MNLAYIILPAVHDEPAFLCLTKNVNVQYAKNMVSSFSGLHMGKVHVGE